MLKCTYHIECIRRCTLIPLFNTHNYNYNRQTAISKCGASRISPLFITNTSPTLAPTRYQWTKPERGSGFQIAPANFHWLPPEKRVFPLVIVFLTYWSESCGRAKVVACFISRFRPPHGLHNIGVTLVSFSNPLVASAPFINLVGLKIETWSIEWQNVGFIWRFSWNNLEGCPVSLTRL